MPAQESPRTTKLYDRMADMIMLKVKRVLLLVGIEAVNANLNTACQKSLIHWGSNCVRPDSVVEFAARPGAGVE